MVDIPSVGQMRSVTQPTAVTARAGAEHWTGTLYMRRISPYVTRLLLPTRITPNGVTALMILAGAGAAVALLWPGLGGALLAVLLTQTQMLLDCSDGELARWRRDYSSTGVFLDKVGHYTAEGLLPLALGIRADGGVTSIDGWTTLGAILAMLVLFNKSLNDMVHVARARSGLTPLPDQAEVAAPRRRRIRSLRSLARFVPFHRAYPSLEFSLLVLLAAVVDAALGDGLAATRLLLVALLVGAVVTVAGHVTAILTSSKLR
jgi:phosphatidylglycerophosphate synthase